MPVKHRRNNQLGGNPPKVRVWVNQYKSVTIFKCSPRQHQVLDLVARGYDNQEIGEMLGLHRQSVSQYLRYIRNRIRPLLDLLPGKMTRIKLAYLHQKGFIPFQDRYTDNRHVKRNGKLSLKDAIVRPIAHQSAQPSLGV